MKKLLFLLLVVASGCNASQTAADDLVVAAEKGQFVRILQLLNSGVDVDSQNQCLNIALVKAAINGRLEMVELLIMRGADVDSRDDEYGDTPLIWVGYHDDVHISELLLRQKAQVNSVDPMGKTALMRAAFWGSFATVKLLLEHRAAVNQEDKEGDTALMKVMGLGNVQTAQLLLQHKAEISNPRIMNYLKDGANSDSDVVKFLKVVGEKQEEGKRRGVLSGPATAVPTVAQGSGSIAKILSWVRQ